MAKKSRAKRSQTPKTKARSGLRVAKKAYEKSLDLAKVAAVGSVVFGVVFGVIQYNQARTDRRIEETLQLFRQFNNAPFTEYRKRINGAVLKNHNEITAAASSEEKFAAAIMDLVQKEDLQIDIGFVLQFFDTVAYCAAKNICDPEIAIKLFYP